MNQKEDTKISKMRNEIEDHQQLKLFLEKDSLQKQNSGCPSQGERDKAQIVKMQT